MLELGYIDEEEYNTATEKVDAGLKFKKGSVDSSNGVYSYHTDALITDVTNDIADKYNISTDFATNYIYMAGLTITSTQDAKYKIRLKQRWKKADMCCSQKQGESILKLQW